MLRGLNKEIKILILIKICFNSFKYKEQFCSFLKQNLYIFFHKFKNWKQYYYFHLKLIQLKAILLLLFIINTISKCFKTTTNNFKKIVKFITKWNAYNINIIRFTWMWLGRPVLSIRLATFTVLPHISYCGLLAPITPATTGPMFKPKMITIQMNLLY